MKLSDAAFSFSKAGDNYSKCDHIKAKHCYSRSADYYFYVNELEAASNIYVKLGNINITDNDKTSAALCYEKAYDGFKYIEKENEGIIYLLQAIDININNEEYYRAITNLERVSAYYYSIDDIKYKKIDYDITMIKIYLNDYSDLDS
jgi:hypothetical protein